ncbi:peptidylprolyl isomerase [Marinobacterium zhoushanense]|uniref:peptidylprolyl isomerase n=1 Tax=Marinobacterium zhoushanense TaxID=1679163 RepID=A0ABQ1KKA5_9GAMM|nr:peptidylprolyl isomerase [Marinobacterium zhoushanense]GGB99268.1 peptidylprolyl isomerase [Marinobacterium zhoushanense]
MQMIELTMVNEDRPEFDAVIVNGKSLDEQRIAQEIQYYPAESLQASRAQAVQALVIRELLMQRAEALGLEVAKTEDGDLDEEALILQLIEREVDLPQATDEVCYHYFEANRDKFCTQPLVAVSHILLAAAPDDLEQRAKRKVQAEVLIEALQRDPELFAEIARQHSDCPSKELGGELGQIDKGQTVDEFERQIFTLPEGLAARPLESRYGFHVTRIDKRVEGEPLPYEAVERRIRAYLIERNYRRAVNQYIQLLVADAEIEGIAVQGADSLLVQ